MNLSTLLFCLLSGMAISAFGQSNPNWPAEAQRYFETKGISPAADTVLVVSLEEQCMYLIAGGEVLREFRISGAALGAGNRSGSNQTPTGLHRVKERHGDEVPVGGILKSRVFTGQIADIFTEPLDVEEDHVTTRVLWLEGMEPGHNKGGQVDSYNRYIYIHGTPEEGLIGKPASHGCIRMFNREVAELYAITPVGRWVLILA